VNREDSKACTPLKRDFLRAWFAQEQRFFLTGDIALNAPWSGPFALKKFGNGTLTLNVANTHSGPTTVNAGPWTNLARSSAGAAFTALVGGVNVLETGSGATRNVEVRDLYLIADPAHPVRFLRLEVTRP
jgi:autotransporter-associated beta strand protein